MYLYLHFLLRVDKNKETFRDYLVLLESNYPFDCVINKMSLNKKKTKTYFCPIVNWP